MYASPARRCLGRNFKLPSLHGSARSQFIVRMQEHYIQQARFGFDPKQFPADGRTTIRMFSNIIAAVSETRELFLDN